MFGFFSSLSMATHVTLKVVSQTKQTEYTPYFRPKWQNLYPISDYGHSSENVSLSNNNKKKKNVHTHTNVSCVSCNGQASRRAAQLSLLSSVIKLRQMAQVYFSTHRSTVVDRRPMGRPTVDQKQPTGGRLSVNRHIG